MRAIHFERAKKYICQEISDYCGLSIAEIYKKLYKFLKNHDDVKIFMIKEGYTAQQIRTAKYRFKNRKDDD